MDRRLETKPTSHSTRKTKNNIFAIPAAVPAIPKKPSAPAMSAMIRNTSDQCNILCDASAHTRCNCPAKENPDSHDAEFLKGVNRIHPVHNGGADGAFLAHLFERS